MGVNKIKKFASIEANLCYSIYNLLYLPFCGRFSCPVHKLVLSSVVKLQKGAHCRRVVGKRHLHRQRHPIIFFHIATSFFSLLLFLSYAEQIYVVILS